MRIPMIKTVFSILGGLLFLSSEANADFLNPPESRPEKEDYDLVELACRGPIVRSKDDAVAGLNSTLLLFRSGNVAFEINNKKFYETFLIELSARTTCTKLFTDGPGMLGSALKTKASEKEETIVLTTPNGSVEVLSSGKIIPLD